MLAQACMLVAHCMANYCTKLVIFFNKKIKDNINVALF